MTLTLLRLRHLGATLLAACAWSSASLAGAAATLDDLGVLPGGGRSPEAAAVSADGTTVVGRCVIDGVGHRGFRWTPATGMQNLGTLPDAPAFSTVGARGVSADGAVIVGAATASDGQTHAFRWTAAGMESYGDPLPGGLTWAATGVSADGTVVGGSVSIFANGNPRAARWSNLGASPAALR